MNKRKALELLKENLEKYLEEGFIFHALFLKEFKKLLEDASGNEKEIFALLVKQLQFIKVLGKNVYTADGNEVIRYQKRDYYSLHLEGRTFNLRLLMTFNDLESPVFLVAFYERSGKRATDYTSWTEVLESRFSETEELT